MSDKYDEYTLKMLALIDEEAKGIQIPDRIKPENMMKRIDDMERKAAKSNIIKRKKWFTVFTGIGATVAAASLVAAILVHQPEVKEIGNTIEDTNVIGAFANNMRHETTEGIYVLSSYKELNEYVVAMETKRNMNEVMVGDTDYDMIVDSDDVLDETYAGDMSDAEGERPTMSAGTENIKGESNSGGDTGNASDDYSETNVRTEGVAEADIVKTDGRYIYHLNIKEGSLLVTSAAGADSKSISELSLMDDLKKELADKEFEELWDNTHSVDGAFYKAELLVSGDSLIVVVQPYIVQSYIYINENDEKVEVTYRPSIAVMTYDISDRTLPELSSVLTLDGEYDSCRLVDGYIYVFAEIYNDDVQRIYDHTDCTEEEAASIYAPKVCGEYLSADEVYIADCEEFNQYHIMAAIDIDDLSRFYDVKAVLGGYGCVNKYVSGSNIYIITDIQNESYEALSGAAGNTTEKETIMIDEQSEIMRFSYKNGDITPNGRVIINGFVGDEFDIDEYNGYLRMAVSTRSSEYTCSEVEVEYYNGSEWIVGTDFEGVMWSSGTEGSALYIYDDNLKLVGSIPQFKENEQVYGVRFDGDIAYVVTYEQTDPLFSIDLSDPANPKVMGALKIPGFSTYLHKWDDNKLIGMGYDENGYIKISTFDITDKYDIRETQVYSLTNSQWSEALYNHKAIFISPQKNLMGFTVEEYSASEEDCCAFRTVYKIFSYIDDRLTEVVSCPLNEIGNNVRGMYIGDYIYIVTEASGVYVYDINSYDMVASVK